MLNRRRRPGTFWTEFGVLILVLTAWLVFTLFVYSPDSTGEVGAVGWFLIVYLPYWAWVIWYRNRGPEEPVEDPNAPTDVVAEPGMVDPMQWHAEWAQRQRNRWESRSFRLLWSGFMALTVAIFVVGVLSRFYLLLAVAVLIAAGLGADWWRYSPHARRSA
ncbi:MAG TPA: hypothetical protein VL403_17750 [Candidatus Kryptonia bacterium]|nr:hypothetical protein [Candidatus Kryptonia bacterium]